MTTRPLDPRRLDVAALAADAAAVEGHWPLAGFPRLAEGEAMQDGELRWSARGKLRLVAGAAPETWLHLGARARLWRDCQRCLQPVALDLEIDRAIRFVADEASAQALDAESDDDVLALPRRLDLHELVEDELLLALPIVPMHERCPVALPGTVGKDFVAAEAAPPAHPFAALAALKRGPKD